MRAHLPTEEEGEKRSKTRTRMKVKKRRPVEPPSPEQDVPPSSTTPLLHHHPPPQPPSPSSGKRKTRRGKCRRANLPSAEHAVLTTAPFHHHQQTSPPPPAAAAQKFKRRRQEQPVASSGSGPSTFLDRMRARLSGGHFRMLNEKLYTCSGSEAFDFFKKDPELFDVYHAGYQQQMSRWPEQPVNVITKWLKNHNPSLTVADFGCGNACLAKSVKNEVYSIDLVSSSPSVIACDMAHTPLDTSSVDVAVFCLSLMGTNFPNYLLEANRVLKPRGWLLIAEVRSRFNPTNGGADSEIFCKAVHELGFSSVSKDLSNKMFLLFYFKKKEASTRVKNIEWPELKPCLYKRR